MLPYEHWICQVHYRYQSGYEKKGYKKDTNPNNKKDEKDSTYSLRDILESMTKAKTDFMYSVILNSLGKEMLPKYIEEGLSWLMQQ